MSEPKPCPFCGSKDVGGAGGQVHCYSCPAIIEVQNTNTNYAVELWNRRADSAELTAARDEAERLRARVSELESSLAEVLGNYEDSMDYPLVQRAHKALSGSAGEPEEPNG